MKKQNNRNVLLEFSKRLKSWSTHRGISQVKIAQRLGVSPQRVGSWFQGKSFPGGDVELRLAEILGLDTIELINGTPSWSHTSNQAILNQSPPDSPNRAVPIISWIEACRAPNIASLRDEGAPRLNTYCKDPKAVAIQIGDNALSPLLTMGNYAVAAPARAPKRDDPVIVRLDTGDLLLRTLGAISEETLALHSKRPNILPSIKLLKNDISWMLVVEERIEVTWHSLSEMKLEKS